jgi:membrane-bound inhibitor of C-type lysozyme
MRGRETAFERLATRIHVLALDEPHLIFTPAETVAGSGGCNRIGGSYTLDGDRLKFGGFMATKMACMNEVFPEQVFLTALDSVVSYRIDDDRLRLFGTNGENIAEFSLGSERLRCDNGNVLLVHYDNSNPEAPRAVVAYEGKSFDMYSVRAASGARYATEQGRAQDVSLEWHTKGDSGVLSEAPLSDTRTDKDVRTVAQCSK